MMQILAGKRTWATVLFGIAVLVLVNALNIPVLGIPADPDWVTRVIELLSVDFLRSGVAGK